jgi:hypothetical protein
LISILDVLERNYSVCDGLVISGSVFGTSGFERTPKFPDLITAEYLGRADTAKIIPELPVCKQKNLKTKCV